MLPSKRVAAVGLSMTEWLRSTRQRLRKAWMSLQVEFQGRYSVERLQQLHNYSNSHGSARMLLVCLLTPLPGLAFSLVKELPPLAPPNAGFFENWVFIIRAWGMLIFFNGSALMQMGHGAPRLKLTVRQILFLSITAATVATAIMIAICSQTVFPLPFGLPVIGIPDVGVIAVLFTVISRPKWRANPSLLVDLKQQLVVYNCQVVLPFVYPIYILGFVSLSGIYQTLFVMVLPIIQLSARNWISRTLADNNDMKPESVIFIVEVFNALYISSALHNSSSWSTTAMVMVIDLIQFWVSMIDIMEILNEMKTLVDKIPEDHPMRAANFMQVAIRLLDIEAARDKSLHSALQQTKAQHVCYTHDQTKGDPSARKAGYAITERRGRGGSWTQAWIRSNTARVLPFRPLPEQGVFTTNPHIPTKMGAAKNVKAGLDTIFSRKERIRFIHKAARVLFMTEYLVLIEYVEVALPIAYASVVGVECADLQFSRVHITITGDHRAKTKAEASVSPPTSVRA
ncbi:hypothetical protein ON010_g17075 [Phytophthora cinnamomi]|nr:hypothetical protein ON010_g17075 [Phytophthora cinnamomi]